MEYSAVSQPPLTPCCFIHDGTLGSMVAAQMTRVEPKPIRTEPEACGAMPASRVIGRSWSGRRESIRDTGMKTYGRSPSSSGSSSGNGGSEATLWLVEGVDF